MERHHPATRAIWWHERQELDAYTRLDVSDPLRLAHDEERLFWQASARASWEEARYWTAWALSEGQAVSAAAFLLTNPMRPLREVPKMISILQQAWHIDVVQAPMLELSQARAFYRAKELTPEDVDRWLRS
jgi:hypothetical protein